MKEFKYYTEQAKNTDGLNLKEIVSFHYFNPNGVHQIKLELDKKINKLVDEGKAKSGSIIAYGTFDTFYEKDLYRLLKKKRPNRIEVNVCVESFKERNQNAEKFIEENK
jgi:hypothetical protein